MDARRLKWLGYVIGALLIAAFMFGGWMFPLHRSRTYVIPEGKIGIVAENGPLHKDRVLLPGRHTLDEKRIVVLVDRAADLVVYCTFPVIVQKTEVERPKTRQATLAVTLKTNRDKNWPLCEKGNLDLFDIVAWQACRFAPVGEIHESALDDHLQHKIGTAVMQQLSTLMGGRSITIVNTTLLDYDQTVPQGRTGAVVIPEGTFAQPEL